NVIRALRWRLLLYPIKKVDPVSCFTSLQIGYTANTILPAHLGEFIRAYLIGKKNNIPSSAVFATIVTERIIDIISLLFFMVLTLLVYPFPDWVRSSGYIMFAGTVVLIMFLFLLKIKPEKTLNVTGVFFKFFPEPFKNKILTLLSTFLDGFVGMKNWQHYLWTILLSIAIWIFYGLFFLFGLLAFNIHLSWIAPVVLIITTTIAIVVPSSPGYVGTFHWICQITLGLFGISKSLGLAFALVIHGVNTIPFFIFGLFLAWREGIQISKINKSYITKENENNENH
nr:flippase-like domain-containing protein [candidate division KSB1 bacterium]